MLDVLEVNAANHIASVVGTEAKGLACTRRGNDTLVAFAHASSVSLQRLTRGNSESNNPPQILFRDGLLLVADWNSATRTQAIVSFSATGNRAHWRRVLLDNQLSSNAVVGQWALAGDRLIVSEWKWSYNWAQGDLLVYKFE